jgi:hypothetical protein
MTSNADPWRTLGLSPGATPDEIRRAYRRLAKINHPDAAGDAALPRFLAIQAAYDQLLGPGRVRRVGGRPGARSADPRSANDASGPEREAWRADPDRARASGRADGRRTPGARPRRPSPGAPPESGRNRGSTDGSTNGSTDGSTDGSTSGRSRRTSARHPPNTATPGSTSYEGADQEPFEPGWSGATWYGASSGTYWTINPKEYADPRKHGPEYQARARRSRGGPIVDGPIEEPDAVDRADESTAAEPTPAERSRGAAPDQPGPNGETDDPPTTDEVAAGQPRHGQGGRRRWPDGAGSRSPAGAASATAASAGAATARAASAASAPSAAGARVGGRGPGDGAPPSAGLRSWLEEPRDDGGFRGPLLRRPTTPTGRLAMAILGWPPLGVFAAAAIDQSTGCGTYAASCPEVSSPGTWIVQAAILLLLLALPAVAAWSAHGAIAALVIGVPSAVALSAGGGSNVRETSGPILLAVLAVAYLGGVAYAVVVRPRPGPS